MDKTKRELLKNTLRGGGGLVLALLFTTPAFAEVNLGDNVLNTSAEVDTKVAAKVAANSAITAATKAKITYDAKGLVTAGADLAASDLPTVTIAKGGTNITSYTVGDLLYASAAGTLAKLADVATGNVLISGGAEAAPSYGKVGLATHVSGTLPVANGGTGIATVAGDGTAGKALISVASATAAAPTWRILAVTDIPTLNQNTTGSAAKLTTARSLKTNLGSTTAVTFDGSAAQDGIPVTGTLPVANGGTGVATVAGNGTAGKALISVASATAAAPTWRILALADLPTITVAKGGTGITSTTQGGIMYGSGTAAYGLSAAGTTGQVLVSQGTSAPVWTTIANIGSVYSLTSTNELSLARMRTTNSRGHTDYMSLGNSFYYNGTEYNVSFNGSNIIQTALAADTFSGVYSVAPSLPSGWSVVVQSRWKGDAYSDGFYYDLTLRANASVNVTVANSARGHYYNSESIELKGGVIASAPFISNTRYDTKLATLTKL